MNFINFVEKAMNIAGIKVIYVRDISDYYFCKRKLAIRRMFPTKYQAEKTVKVGKILHHFHFLLHKFGQDIAAKWINEKKQNLTDEEKRLITDGVTRVLKSHKHIKPNANTQEEVSISFFNGKLRGKIDLVINRIAYEVKFYWKEPNTPFLSDKLQAFTYGYILKSNGTYHKDFVVVEYPFSNREFKIKLNNGELLALFKNALLELIELKFLDALPGKTDNLKKCEYCEIKSICRAL